MSLGTRKEQSAWTTRWSSGATCTDDETLAEELVFDEMPLDSMPIQTPPDSMPIDAMKRSFAKLFKASVQRTVTEIAPGHH